MSSPAPAPDSLQARLTFAYKYIGDQAVNLDVYPPKFIADGRPNPVPAVIYFHGGGLTVGNRSSWFPIWMQKRTAEAGYAFISADYRLVPPSTGQDILVDIKDVFAFVRQKLNTLLDHALAESTLGSNSDTQPFHIDGDALAVAGTSAGGLCAYLAAMHISPKPKVVICMYAMGGNFMTPHYLTPKLKPFSRGFEILDPGRFAGYLHPSSPSLPRDLQASPVPQFKDLPVVIDSPLAYHSSSSPTPGLPANPRMYLARLYLQLGVFLDYYTGEHEPSLSNSLRQLLDSLDVDAASTDVIGYSECLRRTVPIRHHALFPQLGVTSDWPPTFLVHGALDSAVPVYESYHMKMLLEHFGVPVMLSVIEGQEHSFDYRSSAEQYGKEFDLVVEFLKAHLQAPDSDAMYDCRG